MTSDSKHGVLIVGHGSRREEANEDVREAARRIALQGEFALVEPAFLEIQQPDIAAGFSTLVARGATSITVHPYFLSPGRHTRGDIPVDVERAAKLHPDVTWRISEPLSAHRFVIDASVERIRETLRDEKTGDSATSQGVVYLVGAGPGDPELLTIKAHRLLSECDVIIYDSLVNPVVLHPARSSTIKIYAGKIGGGRHTPQHEINAMLISHARLGRKVVRLKGGDPMLFGRGGEEADALYEAGIRFEIVPGISSALAVPAYAGIPVTHRGLSSSLSIITAAKGVDGAFNHEAILDQAKSETLVILMGVAHLAEICETLLYSGRSPQTPAAVIRWGTYEGQQTVTGTISDISRQAESAGIRSPSVIVIGEVVNMRDRLNWFEQQYAGSKALDAVGVA